MFIAHRGLHNNLEIPENSISSFKLALEKNYAIELDIHITKDNRLVVIHDNNLKRMTGVDKFVEELTLNEIKSLNLLNTEERIPLLSEALDLIKGEVLLDIEIKNTKRIKLVCDVLLKELNDYKGDILLKSFNPFIVKTLKGKSNYKVGILISKHSRSKMLSILVKTKIIYLFKFDFIALDINLLNFDYYNKYIAKYSLYVWTFNSINEAQSYIKNYPKINVICNNLLK